MCIRDRAIPAPTAAFGSSSASSSEYRGLGAAVQDEAAEPRWNACGASALVDVDDLPETPPPAGSLILD